MSMNKELNEKLFQRREEQLSHVEYDHEYKFYENITEGNVEEVQKVLADVKVAKRVSQFPFQALFYTKSCDKCC